MFDSADLLAAARLLLSSGPQPASEAQLRRAVSTAYYALFHKVLRAGANRFMGAGTERRAGYGLIYRGFNHGRIKAVCQALGAAKLSPTVQQQLGRTAVSPDMRAFANAFATLQDARQLADYDLATGFEPLQAVNFVDAAEIAMATFDRVADDERADVLALMLLNARA